MLDLTRVIIFSDHIHRLLGYGASPVEFSFPAPERYDIIQRMSLVGHSILVSPYVFNTTKGLGDYSTHAGMFMIPYGYRTFHLPYDGEVCHVKYMIRLAL